LPVPFVVLRDSYLPVVVVTAGSADRKASPASRLPVRDRSLPVYFFAAGLAFAELALDWLLAQPPQFIDASAAIAAVTR
jgi:hypothetical protein